MAEEKDEMFNNFSFDSLGELEETAVDLNLLNKGEKANTKKEEEPETTKKENEDKEEDLIDITAINTAADNVEGEDSSDDEGNETLDKGGANNNTQSDSTTSPIVSFASALHEKGVISSFDKEKFEKAMEENDEEGAYEALFETLNSELEERSLSFLNQLNDNQKEYLLALKNGIPEKDFIESKTKNLEYTKITKSDLEEDITLQRKVYKEFLKMTTKFSEEKIDKLVSQKEALDELYEEATDALPELQNAHKSFIERTLQENRAKEEAAIKANEEMVKRLKENIENTTEIIPGIKLNKTIQEKVFKSMTTPVYEDPNTGALVNAVVAKRMENPIEFEKRLHYLFILTKGFEDFSAITGNVKSSAVRKLKEQLDKNTGFKTSGGTNSAKERRLTDLEDELIKSIRFD
jgi:hypothetical protein